MAVYFAVGTPAEDGRVREFKMIPPPGGTTENQVLVWNAANQEPEWRLASDLGIVGGVASQWLPLVTNTGQYLVTDTGARLVGRAL